MLSPMREGKPSQTALGVAAWLLLPAQERRFEGLLPPDLVAAVTRLLAEGPARMRWSLAAFRRPLLRKLLWSYVSFWSPGILLHLCVRKRYVEDAVREALAAGVRQLVVVGGGFDTLALRLAAEDPDLSVIELDHPATQATKRQWLAASGGERDNLHLEPLDLSSQTLFDVLPRHPAWSADRPAVFVAEGLLMYLTESQVHEVFRFLGEGAAPGTRMVASYLERGPDGELLLGRWSALIRWKLRRLRESFRWGIPPGTLPDDLAIYGLSLVESPDVDELRRRYLAGLEDEDLARWEHLALIERP